MSKEDGLAIRCPQVDGSLLEGLLVDYDVSPGQCTIEVFFPGEIGPQSCSIIVSTLEMTK